MCQKPERDSEKDSGQEIFRVSHLRKCFGDVTPVRDISCEILKGDVISVIGPSGTGKSTFLNLLNQLEKADGGEIYFKGKNIIQPGTDLNLLRRQVGMVFQAFFLFVFARFYFSYIFLSSFVHKHPSVFHILLISLIHLSPFP